MSAAAPVHALFQEACGGRVSGAGGDPGMGQTRVVVATTDQAMKAAEAEEEDPLLKRFVDAAQELVVPEGELASVKELAFAFQRAASRLLEVRTLVVRGKQGDELTG